MKTQAACTLVLMMTGAMHAETPALRVFSAPCSAVETGALSFFSGKSLPLSPQNNCPGCFIGKTSTLYDAAGKKVGTARAMHLYMEPTTRRSNPIVWYEHSRMNTAAHLALRDEGSTCHVSLLFSYSWYGAQFIVFVPVDGDPESRPSNLRLEKEYLDEIAKHHSSH